VVSHAKPRFGTDAATCAIVSRLMPKWEFECIETPRPKVAQVRASGLELRLPKPWRSTMRRACATMPGASSASPHSSG
jgi:hypothetical protein